jgi:hypothetical protein
LQSIGCLVGVVGFSEGRARPHLISLAFEATLFGFSSDPAALPCDKLPCKCGWKASCTARGSLTVSLRYSAVIVVLTVVLSGVGNASCGRYLIQLAGLAVSDRYERGWGSYPTHLWCWLSSVGYIMAYLCSVLGHLMKWPIFLELI